MNADNNAFKILKLIYKIKESCIDATQEWQRRL